ncbi:immunity 22 family protein [Aneurinibacillus sp. REN35]|uniref:immunity 22 family protein n=1 Tax=Aneurinibacillus sp. REN35 TaxID=3237286 RepID=UPI0035287533
MEEKSIVSIWIGRSEDEEKAQTLMEYTYDEDGDAIAPAFVQVYNMEDTYIDEDFVEVSFRPLSSSLTELLEGHSYWESILPALLTRIGETLPFEANTMVLLYDYVYNGGVVEAVLDGVKLRYIGAVPFEEV